MINNLVAKLQELNERIPIVFKTLGLSVAAGLMVWSLLDFYHSRRIENIFRQDLMERLSRDSIQDRYMFDLYIQSFSRNAKIIVTQKAFLDYVSKKGSDNKKLPTIHNLPPSWLPARRIIDADIRYILLLDKEGKVTEIFQNHPTMPYTHIEPTLFMLQKSHEKSYLTKINETPFLIASETFNFHGYEGSLMLATQIDDEFLVYAAGGVNYKNIVAIADGIENRVLAGNRPDLIQSGTDLDTLNKEYIISGKSFFDYGSSDLLVQFVSLKPIKEITGPINEIRSKNRQQIAITAFVFITLFTLIILMIGNRIRRFTRSLSSVSQKLLGAKYTEIDKGDELVTLKKNFNRLCKEIIHANEELRLRNDELRQEIEERKRAEEEREKLEVQLNHTQKMETIGTLAGGIAHDFNNILTPIVNYTTLTMMKLDDPDSCRRYLEQNLKAANRAKELVQQILIFSRKGEIEVKAFQIHPVIEESLRLVRATIPSTIDIRQNLDPSCGTIMGDPTQVQQVLINLCTNSYHAMCNMGGLIHVSLDKINIDAEFASKHPNLRVGEYARLTVSDTGHGMDEATIRRIFDPFFTTKGAGKGTGLGLSVVHGIVVRHGGEIMVWSKPNEGSRFTVYLPLSNSPFREEDNADSYALRFGDMNNILLVDDEVMVARSTQKVLENMGFRVTSVRDGLNALKEFRTYPEKYDLVITDQNMPGITGLQLAEQLRQLKPDLPIILISGYSEDITPEKLREHGIQEFLAKPYSITDLTKAIERALDNEIKNKSFAFTI